MADCTNSLSSPFFTHFSSSPITIFSNSSPAFSLAFFAVMVNTVSSIDESYQPSVSEQNPPSVRAFLRGEALVSISIYESIEQAREFSASQESPVINPAAYIPSWPVIVTTGYFSFFLMVILRGA